VSRRRPGCECRHLGRTGAGRSRTRSADGRRRQPTAAGSLRDAAAAAECQVAALHAVCNRRAGLSAARPRHRTAGPRCAASAGCVPVAEGTDPVTGRDDVRHAVDVTAPPAPLGRPC
jgi:hypothetical protein